MTASVFGKQVQNRNFLSGIAFKFNLGKYPKVDFFSNSAKIPDINLELAQQASYLKNIDVPGERLTFGDFTLRFLVDENMENYLSVYEWLTGLGFPETTQQFKTLTTDVIWAVSTFVISLINIYIAFLNRRFQTHYS